MYHENTIRRLLHFNQCVESIYKKNGFDSIPFDKKEIHKMINASEGDLIRLFTKIFGNNLVYHFFDKYRNNDGNIHDVVLVLDYHNRELFCEVDW